MRPPESQTTPTKGNIQNKIDQLEELVVALMNKLNTPQQSEEVHATLESTHEPATQSRLHVRDLRLSESDTSVEQALSDTFGRMTVQNKEIKYVDSGHWTAILDGVSFTNSFGLAYFSTPRQKFPSIIFRP